MPPRRLPGAPPRGAEGPPPGPLVSFTFDGREYQGVEGEPLAASLLAADRLILSRSFRFHRPRGLMCSTGDCGWCECEVDGRPSVRSCRVPVRAGLVARGEHALPSVERDLLSLVGLASRWIPPTFYHHRFLRPRALRKRYLDVLRWFGGRGRLRLGDRAPASGRPTRRIETDVLVVGGGRAGLLAALGAAEAGGRVVLLDAGVARVGERRGGDEAEAGELAQPAGAVGVQILSGTVAVGWYGGTVAAISDDAHLEIRAGSVVAASGSYDRVPLVPGNDRPGVMAARTIRWLIERHGILPGERALLVGDGDDLLRAGESLSRAGATCLGPVPTASLARILGRRRVTGAVVRDSEGDRRLSVELVVFADRTPNLDLVLAAGADVEMCDGSLVPVCDGSGLTSVASVFVAGSAAGRPVAGVGGREIARAAGRAAAGHAAGQAGSAAGHPAGQPPATRAGRPTAPSSAAAATAGFGAADVAATAVAATAPAALVCFCEDVRAWEIRAEQAAGYDDPELIKRRTGALTGPCQGKYCLQSFACLVHDPSDRIVAVPTARPPLRPIRLGDLVASDSAPDAVGERA